MIVVLAVMGLLTLGSDTLPSVIVERRLAEDGRLRLGDVVSVRALGGAPDPRPFRVAGIFERPADPSRIARNEYEIRFQLPDLEAMLPTHDRVDRFAVALAPGSSPDSVGQWIEGLAYGTRAYPSEVLADESSTTFVVISRFHRAIGIVTVLASGIFLLCVMIIRVDERRRDVGVLRLIGISRRTVLRAVLLEAVAIAAIGSVGGLLLGAVLVRLVNAYYAAVYDTSLRFALLSPQILALAAVLGISLGIGAGLLAALRLLGAPTERLGER